MTAKKSRTTNPSAEAGAAAGDAKIGVSKPTPDALLDDTKASRTRVVGRKVAQAGNKTLKPSSGATGTVTVDLERVRADRIGVTGRLVELGALDHDGARMLEQMITDSSQVFISTASGKTVTLTGVLLGALWSVAAALERGDSITVFGEDAETDRGAAVISSQEAADLLNVSRPFVVKLARTGQLAHQLVGNRHRFELADVLAYAEQMRSGRSRALAALAPPAGTPPKTSRPCRMIRQRRVQSRY